MLMSQPVYISERGPDQTGLSGIGSSAADTGSPAVFTGEMQTLSKFSLLWMQPQTESQTSKAAFKHLKLLPPC